MQRLKLQKTRTWETFTKDRLEKMSDSRIWTCTLSKTRFDDFMFAEHNLTTDGFIEHIKSIEEDHRDDELFAILQSWVDWMCDSFGLNTGSMRQYLSGINKYFRYQRIKITKEDFKDEIELPEEIREEKYALSIEEMQRFIPELMWKYQGFCIGLEGTGMRPIELMGTQKKHYHLINGRVVLEIPWYLTKKRMSRTVVFTKEFNPFIIPILKKLQDEEFAWTKRKTIPDSILNKYSHLNKDKAMNKAIKKFASDMLVTVRNTLNRALRRTNLNMKFETTGYSKINLYSFRGRFFTKALKLFNEDTAHAMIGHGAYLQDYQRRTLEEKMQLWEELETELLIFDLEKKNAEIKKLKEANKKLEDQERRISELESFKSEQTKSFQERLDSGIYAK